MKTKRRGTPGVRIDAYLHQVYQEKKAANPLYSIRAFARYLGMSNSALGQLMNGRRAAGRNSLQRISNRLEVDVETLQGKTETAHKLLSLKTIRSGDVDFLSDPLPLAIIESINLSDFSPNAKWIANRFGVPLARAKRSIQALIDHGYIEMRDGTWVDAIPVATELSPEAHEQAARTKQVALTQLSKTAIEKVPKKMRDHTGLYFAMNKKHLPELRKRLAEFRREFSYTVRQEQADADEVYFMQLALFPITKLKNEVMK